MATAKTTPYTMKISRLTVDKLGVKLYDRVSAVIAEIVANSYDADASKVTVTAPMGEYLAAKQDGQIVDKGFTICVDDNGIGMTPDQVNQFYLVVGAERRNDPDRGNVTRKYFRKVMGRKGVGKLAPFGVCTQIEIISSGGDSTDGKNAEGEKATGFIIAHLLLDRTKIVQDTDQDYLPQVGELDGTIRPKRGTTIILRGFDFRRVPTIAEFERQLAQRFGIPSAHWEIALKDSHGSDSESPESVTVGEFHIPRMAHTTIKLEQIEDATDPPVFKVTGPFNKTIDDITAGFQHDETFYPVTGWVAYSKEPYKDDLMAGLRVYCRNKIASQTALFNLKAGFTGEYDVRSYLVGELQADWLDEDEDLIQTHRQDILWSHELGQAFERWGQSLVKKVGSLTREPKREKAWELFQDAANLVDRLEKVFPGDDLEPIRDNALEFAKLITRSSREEELLQPDYVESVVQLSLLFGPHITLDRKLREAAEDHDDPLATVIDILRTARIAELAGYGKIAEDKVSVIKRIEDLKDAAGTQEGPFQKLVSEAPWLINPEWSPITANRSFTTLKKEFEKFYQQETGKALKLDNFDDPDKRADFVLLSYHGEIQMVEIKRPGHGLQDDEMDRINKYVEVMTNFLETEGNEELVKDYPSFHITVVCDKLALTGVHRTAFNGLKDKAVLTHITWRVFLARTEKMHKEFLAEANRLKKVVPRQ